MNTHIAARNCPGWLRLAAAVVLMAGGIGRGAAEGATIFVTSLADKINNTGGCSLKEAILSANGDTNFIFTSPTSGFFTGCVAGSGDDTIVLPAGQVIFLTRVADDPDNPFGPTATPMVVSRITIEMNGTRLQWNGAARARAFAVASSGDLTLRNAYIRNFIAKGGDGGPGLAGVPFQDPPDYGGGGGGGMGAGGAVYVKGGGSLIVDSCTFEGNGAIGGNGADSVSGGVFGGAAGGGGGIGGNGGGTVPMSLGGGGGGGARGDGARGGGGTGAGSGGGGTLTAGAIGGTAGTSVGGAGGAACGGAGGNAGADLSGDGHDAICSGGGGGGAGYLGSNTIPFVSHSSGGNGQYGGGGGGASAAIGQATVVLNGGNGGFGGGGGGGGWDFFSGGGGTGGFGGGGGGATTLHEGHAGFFGGVGRGGQGGGGAGLGGAIFNDGGTVSIVNSTFTGNFASRGVAGGKDASNGQDAGGAIFSLHGTLSVLNSTISGNQGTGSAAGITVFQIPGLQTIPTFFSLRNTIVSNNGALACVVFGLAPALDGSGNLIQENAGCPGAITDADPMLGPLQINDGLTPTMAIADASPALDAGDVPPTTLLRDQRGALRPQGNGYDIGAYEACVFNPKVPCFGFHDFQFTRHLDTSAFPAVGGTVSPPSGDYTLNSVQPLNATPNAGFSFMNWSGNVANPTSAPTFVVMDQDQTVTANFAGCLINVSGRATAGTAMSPPRVDLTWAPNGAGHADVLRSATSGGPYASVGSTTTTSFTDTTAGLVNNTKAYYVLQFFAPTGVKMCDSSEVAVTIPRGR